MSKTGELTLLAEALEAWKETREGVLAEFKNIPASQMVFIPTKGARSVASIVRHIIEHMTHPPEVPQERQVVTWCSSRDALVEI